MTSPNSELGKTPMATKLFNSLEDPPTSSPSDDNEVKTSSGSETDSDSGSETKKRASEGTTKDKNVKRAKKFSGEDKKKKLFQRIWSEEDEISLLQAMVDFKAETGTSPYDEMDEFYDIVKGYISFDVSKTQFVDKIRSLKKKYFGKEVVKSSHDEKCLGLAKCIWVDNTMALDSAVKVKEEVKEEFESVVMSDGKIKKLDKEVLVHGGGSDNSKKVKKEEVKEEFESDGFVFGSVGKLKKLDKEVLVKEEVKEKFDGMGHKEVLVQGGDSESANWFENSFLVRSMVSFGVDEYSVKQKWSIVSMEAKKSIEEKLKLVKAMEFELLLEKADILKEVTSVISEAI